MCISKLVPDVTVMMAHTAFKCSVWSAHVALKQILFWQCCIPCKWTRKCTVTGCAWPTGYDRHTRRGNVWRWRVKKRTVRVSVPLCVQEERWRGNKKTKGEENMAHKIEGSGIWRENVGKRKLFLSKGHRWCRLRSGGVWIKHVSPRVYVKKVGRFIIDWLSDTHSRLVKSGGGTHAKAWPHAMDTG